jgi:hypothetical protein
MKKAGNAYTVRKPNVRPPKVKMSANKKTLSRMVNRLKPGSKKR